MKRYSLLGAGAISQLVVAHVLYDDVTVAVLVCTGVLVGPFNGQDGAFIVVEITHIVATSVVVLRVKHPAENQNKHIANKMALKKHLKTTYIASPVSIVPFPPGFIKSVVAPPKIQVNDYVNTKTPTRRGRKVFCRNKYRELTSGCGGRCQHVQQRQAPKREAQPSFLPTLVLLRISTTMRGRE